MNTTKFFEIMKDYNCEASPFGGCLFHLIAKDYDYNRCMQYKKLAAEWNATKDNKYVLVNYELPTDLDPVDPIYKTPCMVIAKCKIWKPNGTMF